MADNEDKSIDELDELFTAASTDVLAIVDGISGETKKIEVDNLVAAHNEVSDNSFKIFNEADNTKKIQFDAQQINTGTTRVITAPDRDLNLTIPIFDRVDTDNIRMDGNTVSTTDTDGDLILSPDGTGKISAGTSIISNVVDPVDDQDAATRKFVLDNVGAITSYFEASISTNLVDVTGNGDDVNIVFDTVTDNVGGDYDNTTGKYTAPSDGYMFFSWSFRVIDVLNAHDIGSLILTSTGAVGRTRFLNQSNVGAQRSGPGPLDFYVYAGSIFLKVFNGAELNLRLAIGGGTKVIDIEAVDIVQIPAFFSGVMLIPL